MSDDQRLLFEKSGAIARITLNRPKAANGFDEPMMRELAALAARCDADRTIKAVILTGSGRFFSAGGDLKGMGDAGDARGAYVKRLADNLHRATTSFARMDAPLIVAVNGVAAGGGFSLAIAGDLVIAARSASFTMAYTRAGLSPDGSSSYFLPRLVGLRRAQELMFTNRTLSAPEALDWGLVTEVVEDDALTARAEALAAAFVAGSRGANANVKKLLNATYGQSLETQMEMEGRLVSACADSAEGREGIDAFIAKRAPQFP
jgi:2-(1,2-epoxy-1,2-dihydrophenyl)acetyl-CoA isomerase